MRFRRAAVCVLFAAGAAGCTSGGTPQARPATPSAAAPTPSAPAGEDRTGAIEKALRGLEREYGARLGVWAIDTGTGDIVAWRSEERFAFASTFKPLLCGVMLQRISDERLDRRLRWKASDVVANSPVSERRVRRGMSPAELCEATIRHSDNTAANLILAEIGGPRGFTAALRALGDTETRSVRIEPEMSDVAPGDLRDTTTPRAFAGDLRAFLLGDALPEDRRALLTGWLSRPVALSAEIRGGFPEGWTIHGKTGTTVNAARNYIAVAHPPAGAPVALAVLTQRADPAAGTDDTLLAEAVSRLTEALTSP